MARPFRLGVGGRIGTGQQWVPWIHVDDLVNLIRTAVDDARFRGPINAVAPEPVRNADLTRELARALRRPALLPVPGVAVRALLREVAGEISIPSFAIGGVDQSNLQLVIDTGIRRIAVTAAVQEAADPAASAEQLRAQLTELAAVE